MNKVNLMNIYQKLNFNEVTIKKMNFQPIEDSFDLTKIEKEKIEKIVNRLSQIVNYEEMVTDLSKSKLYGSAYNYIDFDINKAKKIERVNIGLFNRDIGKIEETSVKPNVFIDIFTNLTAVQIEKNPQKENYYKETYIKLLKYFEENKI